LQALEVAMLTAVTRQARPSSTPDRFVPFVVTTTTSIRRTHVFTSHWYALTPALGTGEQQGFGDYCVGVPVGDPFVVSSL
jgi:hypothetical protein